MDNKELLEIITDNVSYDGAFNIRINGKLHSRNNVKGVTIVSKTDVDGIDIFVEDNVKNQTIAIPVIVTAGGLTDKVYNTFHIGENCDVVIVAGCGIENCSQHTSAHNGIHTFYVGKNSKLKYVERHFGHGTGTKNLDPETVLFAGENSEVIFYTTQIEGVDNTTRTTTATLEKNARVEMNEKVKTHANQIAKSIFEANLNGDGCRFNLCSRSVATENSSQNFVSDVVGNADCYGRVECDAIITDGGKVCATPKIVANHLDASLTHEASIGKIAGEQLVKLLTLGLNEDQARDVILNGFLK